jgi:hypothetical protein
VSSTNTQSQVLLELLRQKPIESAVQFIRRWDKAIDAFEERSALTAAEALVYAVRRVGGGGYRNNVKRFSVPRFRWNYGSERRAAAGVW